tara:strand:+ start:576 stop:833 length:258 start_codon:yes stop_codon:yes gene_type:complete
MSFYGTKLRKSWYELEQDEAYDQEALLKCKAYVDTDIQDIDRQNNDIVGFNDDLSGDDSQTDIYNHLTIFKSEDDEKACVYLLTY